MKPLSSKAFPPTGSCRGPSGLPLVSEALQARGWSEEDIQLVLGANVLTLFHAKLGRPAAPATGTPI
ncbi:hypothetical protein ACH4UM_37440 [Streptomyces sp. NPDC020801]|uniref:hypothetical protein n=1 Tax=unclassified Streptomyces TaxID=2593676 RepID=UPI00379073B7